MSEADVSLIRDEDVLRRMWQQTEDFSKKKEIRAHMYRLREERLRNLYSPEPSIDVKGGRTHVKSFADQSFQSLKSKEVRDAGSPPKEFTYRGAELKELSNAGWNVESENSTSDDGHTRVQAVQANIEGRYDVEGGAGQFAAADSHRQAVTEYSDDKSSLKRNETASNTSAHEQILRQTDDGTHFSSTTSSSTASKYQQVSATKHEVPYTDDDSQQKVESKVSNTTNYEHSLRKQDYSDQGELISRKVEYPDDNMKVVTETRCLPDGTRVTSTRREYRGPAVQSSHSEQHQQQTRSECKYSSTQNRSDVKESSTQMTRDSRSRDVKASQKIVDDSTKNAQIDTSTKNVERTATSNVEDYKNAKNVEYTFSSQERKQHIDNRDEVRSESTIRNTQTQDEKNTRIVQDSVDKIHDKKFEEQVERKTSSDQYQTTYQSDFTQKKKISNDFSPTHQAWASSLRADTPSTPRSSIRASSPSRTYASSNSSLRSSVSPEKNYRKPSSRGGSPSKIDRQSPTRSDRYSSHSTITETRTTNYSSPTRSYSPDKKDGYRQRPSVSPEKKPQDKIYRPSSSPDGKATDKPPSVPRDVSPSKPRNPSPFRSTSTGSKATQSPDRQSSSDLPRSNDRSSSPYKFTDITSRKASPSPDRKLPTETDKKTNEHPADLSTSPDRKPGYMRPTAASQPRDNSPTKSFPKGDRKSPSKAVPSQSPERKHNEYKKSVTKIEEDHYKFVDEETKMYERTEKEQIDTNRRVTQSSDKVSHDSISLSRKNPTRDTTDFSRSGSPSLTPSLKTSRSPSPPKGPVTFTDIDIKETHRGKTEKVSSQTNVTNHYDKQTEDCKRTSKDREITTPRQTPVREPSPTKYGTFDKKRYSEEKEQYSSITTEDKKYDTLTRRNKNVVKKDSSEPITPTRKSSRDTLTPAKSPSKDRYSHTTDFISTEKTTEEINKRTSNDHPRQLVTPSSSPTRKPKTVEKSPSTGQSSPTTSVSEFSYFSPTRETNTIVTDLDDHFYAETNNTEIISKTEITKRPDKLEVKRTPSPTKIPCRSPSPEKKSPVKESLPRKSSLKKPSVDALSPTEKPPTTFKVSPTVETNDFPGHKVVNKLEDKVKPPLERRETYEERCRKILGMMEDEKKISKTETIETITTNCLKEPASNTSSPSVSPCASPEPREDSPFTKFTETVTNTKYDVTDFLTREKEEMTKTTREKKNYVSERKSKTPSRESSPTKLKDIISVNENVTKSNMSETLKKSLRSSISPSRRAPETPKHDIVSATTKESKTSTTSTSKTVDNKSIYTRQSPSTPTTPTSSIPTKTATPTKKPEIPKSRTPSPTKKKIKVTEESTDLILSEREQEILDKVQKSLRKLSPTRENRSPSREKSPTKTTTSLQDIDISSTNVVHDEIINITEKSTVTKEELPQVKTKEQKTISKPASRNASPIKKQPVNTPKTPDSPTKFKSIPSRKTISPTERPSSPQVPKTNGTRPKEAVNNRRPTPAYTPTKQEKSCDMKKSGIPKQNSSPKITTKSPVTNRVPSTPGKTAHKPAESTESKREAPKDNKENVSPKKDDAKFTRTTSDTSMKAKKPLPTRVKSKPEIQVTDVSSRTTKQTTDSRTQKSTSKDTQTKLTSKPKSATALNTHTDENDIIVDDVEQAKSSRENSPDRICPTPVSFLEDVGTPRYPDEVSEPDDEFRRRTHHIIHETESIVDDIVEISEEEELFTTNVDKVTGSDECLLSVNDKVSKFTNKIDSVAKPKDGTTVFKDTEKRVHSDFIDENLKSDECLLSVSQKVTKFASGPKDKSPSRSTKLSDEYDCETTYTDDYSKRSVNDKAHYFVETAENVSVPKTKPCQKVERPDLSDVDDSLRSDDCLLSVSDKVNKFVKTAEQFLNENTEVEDKERKIREQHEKIMRAVKNLEVSDDEEADKNVTENVNKSGPKEESIGSFAKETASSHAKNKDYASPNLKSTDRTPIAKITTLRSSEAVKKAKALFENISSTTQKTTSAKDATKTKTTKLTDIGVIMKSSKTDSTTVLHPSLENVVHINDEECAVDAPVQNGKEHRPTSANIVRSRIEHKQRQSPARLAPQPLESIRNKSPLRNHTDTHRIPSPEPLRPKSPMRQSSETTKIAPSKYTSSQTVEPQKTPEMPGYQRATVTSHLKEETKVEDYEVSSRRGSGKFGVELRRTSVEQVVRGEARRPSDHLQPCIEDIHDLDLLEQMLEKVSGYEQRRRIRAQIRVVKKRLETENVINTNTYTRTTKTTLGTSKNRSPVRLIKTPKNLSPDRSQQREQTKPSMNGYAKEPLRDAKMSDKRQRPHSPEKMRSAPKTRSPVRQSSPEKKSRTHSPTKAASPKVKPNRFNEYASAYMKKVGLTENEKQKFSETKTKKSEEIKHTTYVEPTVTRSHETEVRRMEVPQCETASISKSYTSRTSEELIEVVQVNGKRSPSPSPERRASPERLYYRTPSPDFKRTRADAAQHKETIIKTVVNKSEEPKTSQEEKPSWVMNRNLKKISSETRTFSSKKLETEKKYRATSPSKVISKPIDVITSSYGIGPLGEDGKPLFGIKALRNGATNYQVKGTVVQSEYHSRNGAPATGSVSVTTYASDPGALEALLSRADPPPSRLHGLAAITTTKKFGGTTGTSLQDALTKEDRASIEQFTHHDRKLTHTTTTSEHTDRDDSFTHTDNSRRVKGITIEDITAKSSSEKREKEEKQQKVTERVERKTDKKMERREDRKNVRQSSVKSLTEKFIKNASDTSKSERAVYPKAGLILRSNMKDSFTSDPGLPRTDSEHSINSAEEVMTKTTSSLEEPGSGCRQTRSTVTTSRVQTSGGQGKRGERSFLDSTTKVTGVQDILTRMKNADIVIEAGDSCEDAEARALLNKFLGATVLMAGMQAYVTDTPQKAAAQHQSKSASVTRSLRDLDVDKCWDEQLLRRHLEESTDYEQRRRLRARLRTLMAEQEACANAVTEALSAECGATATEQGGQGSEQREEEEVTTVTSSVRRNSSEKSISSSTTTKSSKVIESMTRPAPKPVSPFAKFRQLEKQNSTTNPNSPATPQSPGSPSQPYFKFTDPALQASAVTIKERLLQWCRDKTRDYENVKLENFSTSWADGLAFCALVHHFLPDTFDYSKLTPDKRRSNFTLAFKVADEKAGIYPLLDVDDMVAMRKPDWKCVFTYVQSIHRRFKDQQ